MTKLQVYTLELQDDWMIHFVLCGLWCWVEPWWTDSSCQSQPADWRSCRPSRLSAFAGCVVTMPCGHEWKYSVRLHIGWQWCNFIPYPCQLFFRHDAGQALRNVLLCIGVNPDGILGNASPQKNELLDPEGLVRGEGEVWGEGYPSHHGGLGRGLGPFSEKMNYWLEIACFDEFWAVLWQNRTDLH